MQNRRGPLKKALTRPLRLFLLVTSHPISTSFPDLMLVPGWRRVGCMALHNEGHLFLPDSWRMCVTCFETLPLWLISLLKGFHWKFTTLCSKDLWPALFCTFLTLATSCPALLQRLWADSRADQNYLHQKLFFISIYLQVPVGRHTSKHRLNQHLKNSESWAAASLS